MRQSSFIYALISTLYTAIAIIVFLLIIKPSTGNEFGIIFISPIVLFPLICTFLSGYVIFPLKIKPWLVGLIHFIFAHVLAWLCYCLLFFLIRYSEINAISQRLTESLNGAFEMILFSLIGGIWIFPGFVLLSYFLKRKRLPSK